MHYSHHIGKKTKDQRNWEICPRLMVRSSWVEPGTLVLSLHPLLLSLCCDPSICPRDILLPWASLRVPSSPTLEHVGLSTKCSCRGPACFVLNCILWHLFVPMVPFVNVIELSGLVPCPLLAGKLNPKWCSSSEKYVSSSMSHKENPDWELGL